MFLQVFLFDLKRNLKRPSTWLFFSSFFVFTAVYLASLGGLIPGVRNEASAYFNSARSCALVVNGLINNSLIGTIILITLIAPVIQKDFQYNSQSIYFTKPISKFGYVIGRFTSGYLTALIVLMGTLIAYVLMCNLSIYPSGKVGSYGLWNYLQGFIYLIIPNTFFVGTLFFCIVTLTRNLIAGYIASVVLLIALNNDSLMPANLGSMIIALKDPYGGAALYEMTKNWTPEAENTLEVSFTGYLLYNRIFWMIISGLLFLFTYLRFDFQQGVSKFSIFSKKKKNVSSNDGSSIIRQSPIVTSIFDISLSIKQWISLTKLELKNLIKSPYFIIILLVPTIMFLIDGDRGSKSGVHPLPTTFRMIDAILNFSKSYLNIIIIFYSGALVWRERTFKIEDLVSSTPLKTWVLMFSKIASLAGMYVLIIIYFILFFIFFQLGRGFTDIQPFVYFQYLFGYNLFNIIILVCFVVSMQAIVNNKYWGYLISVIIIFFIPIMLDKLSITNGLIRFNSGNRFLFSAMNGVEDRFAVFLTYKIYWLAFISVLLITANLMWSRGKEQVFKSRIRFAGNNLTRFHLLAYLLSLGCMILFGIFL